MQIIGRNGRVFLEWVLTSLLGAVMFAVIVYYVVLYIVAGLALPIIEFRDAEFLEDGTVIYQPLQSSYCGGEEVQWEPHTYATRDADITILRTLKFNHDGVASIREIARTHLSLEAGELVVDKRTFRIPEDEGPGDYYILNSFTLGGRTARYRVPFYVSKECQ
jgi:hypothetical protein